MSRGVRLGAMTTTVKGNKTKASRGCLVVCMRGIDVSREGTWSLFGTL